MSNTYISLFSSAGVGCFGFKMEGFECIATNELIERRLQIQKFNKKCKYDSGYICGDITLDETKKMLYSEIDMWKKKEELKQVDVVIATPPCQGMSVANHKKNDTEIIRNSLVIESIKIIKTIQPKFFIFENVPAFMKTVCTDIDGFDKPIGDAIYENLGKEYSYIARVINFKNYGACSSRSRTVVIGVSKKYSDEVSPLELYPIIQKEKTLRETIGHLKSLTEMGEIDENDIYHSFRKYPLEMRNWISCLKEGQSAFDNEDLEKKPHQIIDGKIVVNKQKNADKYTRQFWDKVGPCVHTRNDQLASQNTIHPNDDRVFSIRELMLMMTVPYSFKWSELDINELNKLSISNKEAYLKKEEIKIRQSLGEAVPTTIFQQIASNIKNVLSYKPMTSSQVIKFVKENSFDNVENLEEFIKSNKYNFSLSTLSKIAELSNTSRTEEGAFYTNKELITEIMKSIVVIEKDIITILEPSAGVGNFIPLIAKKFESKEVYIDLVDIDANSLLIAKVLLAKYDMPKNIHLNFINDDFLTHKFDKHYDYIIGNPPFFKLTGKNTLIKKYKKEAKNKDTNNICSYFLDKSIDIGNQVILVFPKFILNTPEFKKSRDYLSCFNISNIIDFGEKGFPGVLIETIALFVNKSEKPKYTVVNSITKNIKILQEQKYIFDKKLPYWIIYRNKNFDKVSEKMEFNVFDVFRDRQLTNTYLKRTGDIRVIKARNINDTGTAILNIDNYDDYVNYDDAKKMTVFKYLNSANVYITPNMTYNPRVMKKPNGTLVNGSVAILIPKKNIVVTDKQCLYFSSNEYREFYQVARNYQTRSLNVDSCSVYFYGLLLENPKYEPLLNDQLTIFDNEEGEL